VKAVDRDQQVFGQTRHLEQWIQRENEYAYGRLVAALFSAFSLVALALAAAGLLSVVSYGVAQRTDEFGIRMALGGTRAHVLRIEFGSTVADWREWGVNAADAQRAGVYARQREGSRAVVPDAGNATNRHRVV
jgi:hypothetical protein